MSNQAISTSDVLTMASRLGFRPGQNAKGQYVLNYASMSGFAMEFAVPWLKQGATYSSEQVETQLAAMMQSAKMDEKVYDFLKVKGNVEAINGACKKFGMVYDEGDGRFYYVKDGSALFGVDHDYIASLICTGKASLEHLDDMLDTFRDTAEYEYEQSLKASGSELVGQGLRKKTGTGKRKKKDG